MYTPPQRIETFPLRTRIPGGVAELSAAQPDALYGAQRLS